MYKLNMNIFHMSEDLNKDKTVMNHIFRHWGYYYRENVKEIVHRYLD